MVNAVCPYCREDLRVELTAQFVERVDPAIVNMYSEELERMQKRYSVKGGMFKHTMRMTVGMTKGLQETATRGMLEYPPIVTVLKCMNCGVALSVNLPSSGSSG